MKRHLVAALAAGLVVGGLAAGCSDKENEDECTEDVHRCDSSVLEVCADGAWEVEEDCADSKMMCHDMGDDSHCMMEGDM